MESPPTVTVPAETAASQEAPLSLGGRVVAIFTRPASAWGGLTTRPQWWFPMIIMMLFNVAFAAGLWDRAILPTQISAMEQQVSDGKMSAEALDRAETMMRGPAGLMFAALPWIVISPLINLFIALVIMLVVGFVLGGKLPFRLSLEVATWSGLINLPALIITAVLAWGRQTMEGMHLSLAALLPEPEGPARPMRIVMGVLDGLGPFAIWSVVVMILGASVLSGVARKRAAWGLGTAYAVLVVFFSVLGALFRRSG